MFTIKTKPGYFAVTVREGVTFGSAPTTVDELPAGIEVFENALEITEVKPEEPKPEEPKPKPDAPKPPSGQDNK